jgi:hypothetical protein
VTARSVLKSGDVARELNVPLTGLSLTKHIEIGFDGLGGGQILDRKNQRILPIVAEARRHELK